MESRGLIARSDCSEDARGTWITLTAEGRRATLRAMRDHAAKLRELFFDVLDDEEKAAIQRSALRVLDRLNPPACELMGEKQAELAG